MLSFMLLFLLKLNGGVHSEACHEVDLRHNATHLYVDVAGSNGTETTEDLVVEPLNVTAVADCPGGSSQR